MTYQTPSACYKKAPVRRETILERAHRHRDQLPTVIAMPDNLWYMGLVRRLEEAGHVTINKDLEPGSATFVQEVTH